MRSKPPSRCSAPSTRSSAFPTHGVVSGPTLIFPSAASKQPSPSRNSFAWIQVQRSACSRPQLWPIIPGQASTSIASPSTVTEPEKRASGYGDRNLVFGSGAR